MTTDSKETEDLKKKLLRYNNLADGKVGSETRGALARPSPPEKHALFTARLDGAGGGFAISAKLAIQHTLRMDR